MSPGAGLALRPPAAVALGPSAAVARPGASAPLNAGDLFDRFADTLLALGGPPPGAPFAVAFSGGGDSLALLLLARRFAEAGAAPLLALVVQHGMREQAPREARAAARLAEELQVPCRVLEAPAPFASPAGEGGSEAAARRLRYRLLEAELAERGIPWALFGHLAEDRRETLALRRAAASGPAGLAGIPARRASAAALFLRPLLGFERGELAGLLSASGLAAVEDASNRELVFARNRLRSARARDAARDPAAARARCEREEAELCLFARRRRREEQELERDAARLVRLDAAGFAEVDGFADLPEARRRLLLARLLMVVAGRGLPPPSRALAALDRAIAPRLAPHPASAPGARGARGAGTTTLAGCRLLALSGKRGRAARLFVLREPVRPVPLLLEPGKRVLWDGRFSLAGGAEALLFAPLGVAAFARLRRIARMEEGVREGVREKERAGESGSCSWRFESRERRALFARLPSAVGASLPAAFRAEDPSAPPRCPVELPAFASCLEEAARPRLLFAPPEPLVPVPFVPPPRAPVARPRRRGRGSKAPPGGVAAHLETAPPAPYNSSQGA